MRRLGRETIIFDEPLKRGPRGSELFIDEQRVIFRQGIGKKATIILTHPAPFLQVFNCIGDKAFVDLRSEVGWAEVQGMGYKSFLRLGLGVVCLSGEIQRGSELVHGAELYTANNTEGLENLGQTFKSYAASPDYRAQDIHGNPVFNPNAQGVIDFTSLWDQGIRPYSYYHKQREF